MKVNIYIVTLSTGVRQLNGTGMYMLQALTSTGEPVTIKERPAEVSDVLHFEHTSYNAMTMTLLAEALKRMQKSAEIRVFTLNEYVFNVLNNHLKIWQDKDWKNARGITPKNVEKWQEIAGLLEQHTYIAVNEHHSYEKWMMEQMKKGGK